MMIYSQFFQIRIDNTEKTSTIRRKRPKINPPKEIPKQPSYANVNIDS